MATHLTFQERQVLQRLIKAGKSKKEMAEVMGRDRSTIYRELARNSGQRGYRPQQAQRLARQRRVASRRPCKMEDPRLFAYVQDKLQLRWSPEQIDGTLQITSGGRAAMRVSRQTIYNWIRTREPTWKQWLRRRGRPPETRGKLSDCVRIDGRPDVINRRRRYGDWEGDTIIGAGRRSALVTLVDRKSGFTRMGRADDLTAPTTRRTIVRRMKTLPASLRRSVTFDNGKEFAEHQQFSQTLNWDTYFALPYKSWQRGTNENTNGLIRDFFPKGTDFTCISHQAVARVEKLLNERPRKRLGYKTPKQVLARHLRCN